MKLVSFNNGFWGLRRNVLCIPGLYQYLDLVDLKSGALNWRARSDYHFADCQFPEDTVRRSVERYQETKQNIEDSKKNKYGKVQDVVLPGFCEKIRNRLAKLVGKAA